ncbi:NADPH-dependent ferric siderophore reductase, contains FAD-binding and SIP domains [Sinosporangium album]|uniref:NADPH-dependent ferric siderophore reductase, contains FAD-binding and SIP domains n=1 Tax=Sinosporangium album TaxID=504805 RepID=A0A1G8GPL0_9ACTN|nr:siderophore-interacting protein [Sinosporangium album]SDH96273.1 NADPH-dependent ferric siderophore reductase, contains FAD-binding and SIP domains [Sinosporangium album]
MSYSKLDQLQFAVVGKVASMMMAMPERRTTFEQFLMTVSRVEALGPHIRRITFHAPEFSTFALSGADEYFGLLIPRPDASAFTMPSAERLNLRQAVQKLPEAERPDLRWYTIRAFRPEVAEIDVDVVLHGDAGPGSRWAGAAAPGDVAGFRASGSSYRVREPGLRQLLVADEAAMPALSAILEALPVGAENVQAMVELPDESYKVEVDTHLAVRYLFRGGAAPGSLAVKAVADAAVSELDYAWVCGESALATGIRRHLVKERGLDRKKIMFSGYWKLGQARY